MDISTVFPEKLAEAGYLAIDNKVKMMQELSSGLEMLIERGSRVDVKKDYSMLFNALTLALEEANQLVHQEGLKIFHLLIAIYQT